MITAEVAALARRYRLALEPTPRGGRAGEVRGAGLGSSVEFQDRRDFLPGDDLRRLDWRALARTDRMLLRQHREEVSPTLELLVDTSASMASEPDKARRTVELALLLLEAAQGEGWRARLTVAEGAQARPVSRDELLQRGLSLEGKGALLDLARPLAARLAPGSLVLVLSDLLFPGEAAALVNPLAARAGRLGLLQLLGAEDQEPPLGSFRLTDAESGEVLERAVDTAARAAYQARLARHVAGYSQACRRVGATFASLSAAQPIDALAAGALLTAGVLTPAAMAGG